MSISYLIAFDKKLEKTDYLYTYIFNEGKTVWGQKDKIVFSDDLCPQEQEIAMNIFPQRKVYSIHSSVPLSYKISDKENVSDDYYLCEKEQLVWFFKFLKKHINCDQDVLFIKVHLGPPTEYKKLKVIQVDINDMELPENDFSFENYIYQFVNNKRNNRQL